MTRHRRGTLSLAVAALLVVGAYTVVPDTARAARITSTCTGTGDSARLQSAINASSSGDEIVISGTCVLTAPLSLRGNRTYRGDSRATTLTMANGVNLPALVATDGYLTNTSYTGEPVTIRDLTLDGNRGANPSAGSTLVIRSWLTTVENLTVQNSTGNGILVTNTSRGGTTISNSQVNGTIRNVFVTSSGANGIYIEDSGGGVTDWNLLENWIADSGQSGIKTQNAAGWVIERNHVYGNGAAGIHANRLFATSISDNYIEDFVTDGISVTVQGDAASAIAGNKLFQFKGTGTTFLAVNQVNYGSGQLVVTGNTVRGKGTGTGLSYQRGSYPLTVTSSGNNVSGVTTARLVGSGVVVNSGV